MRTSRFLLSLMFGFVVLGLASPVYAQEAAAGAANSGLVQWSIITAGFAICKGEVGTLGELSPKPHPWLYAEAARVGLGIDFAQRHHVIGIEDSGAGVCSIRLAGFAPIGFAGGNINESGTRALCTQFADQFGQILSLL